MLDGLFEKKKSILCCFLADMESNWVHLLKHFTGIFQFCDIFCSGNFQEEIFHFSLHYICLTARLQNRQYDQFKNAGCSAATPEPTLWWRIEMKAALLTVWEGPFWSANKSIKSVHFIIRKNFVYTALFKTWLQSALSDFACDGVFLHDSSSECFCLNRFLACHQQSGRGLERTNNDFQPATIRSFHAVIPQIPFMHRWWLHSCSCPEH